MRLRALDKDIARREAVRERKQALLVGAVAAWQAAGSMLGFATPLDLASHIFNGILYGASEPCYEKFVC